MPRQFIQMIPGERKTGGKLRATGGDANMLGRSIDGRSQWLSGGVESMVKFVFQLGLADAMRHGIANSGVLVLEHPKLAGIAGLRDEIGKFVGAVKGDRKRIEFAGNQSQMFHRLAECLDAGVGDHGVGECSGYPLASTLRNASQAATMRLSSATTSA